MKINRLNTLLLIVVCCSACVITGCSKEEDEPIVPPDPSINTEGTGSSNNKDEDSENYQGVPVSGRIFDGMIISKISPINIDEYSLIQDFLYDSNGRLIQYKRCNPNGERNYEFNIDYNNKQFNESGYNVYSFVGDISFNKNGYITKLHFKVPHGHIADNLWEFEYDDGYHLSKAKEYSDDGIHYTDYLFVWEGNLLKSWSSNGPTEYWNSYNISYGSKPNKFEQYSEAAMHIDDPIDFLMIVGLLGKGPDREITKVETIGKDYQFSNDIAQIFSNDGRLIQENYDGYTHSKFEYKPLSSIGDDDNKGETFPRVHSHNLNVTVDYDDSQYLRNYGISTKDNSMWNLTLKVYTDKLLDGLCYTDKFTFNLMSDTDDAMIMGVAAHPDYEGNLASFRPAGRNWWQMDFTFDFMSNQYEYIFFCDVESVPDKTMLQLRLSSPKWHDIDYDGDGNEYPNWNSGKDVTFSVYKSKIANQW